MHDARDDRGALSRTLGAIAAGEAAAPAPYDFHEFLRRAARRDARGAVAASPPPPPAPASRGARVLRVAAVLAPLALLAVLALALRPVGQGGAAPREATGAIAAAERPLRGDAAGPALVNVAAAGDRVQLEDHIALVDALLNEAALAGAPEHDRAALLAGRRSLTESLQRVRYAETLLADY